MAVEIEKGHVGQSFDDFLEEEGRLEESTLLAVKRVIAYQLTEAMKEQKLSKTVLAKRIHTSRSQLDRLLDPQNTRITLETLERGARGVGRKLQLTLQ